MQSACAALIHTLDAQTPEDRLRGPGRVAGRQSGRQKPALTRHHYQTDHSLAVGVSRTHRARLDAEQDQDGLSPCRAEANLIEANPEGQCVIPVWPKVEGEW